ncbi:MAG: PqqD family protein [Planctomycetota bacterium]
MPLNWFKRRNAAAAVTRRESLDATVVCNAAVEVTVTGSGTVTLTVTRDRSSLPARVLMGVFGLPDRKRIILDRRGTCIWNMCDGKVTVREMIERFAREFTLDRKETEVLIVYYLKTLARRGLAGIIIARR